MRSALAGFIWKETHHILRDRQTLTLLLLLPLAMVILFGFALRSDIRDVRVVFVDASPDYATTALRARFEGNPRFSVIGIAPATNSVEHLFLRGDADVAIVIEPGFADRLASGSPSRLLVISDATDPNTGSMMQAYAAGIITDFQEEMKATGRPVDIEMNTRMRFNPTLESANLFVPGLIALVLTLVTALMTAISLSREMERGTLEILLVSPLRPWQIIVGKVVPYLVLAFANVVTALLSAWLVFDVPFRGSVTLLLAASVLYAMVGLALGVVIAARTDSQRAAMLGALLGTMMPITLLSGMIFPITSLPGWMQVVTYIVPARWFIIISRGIMLKGVGIEYLWPSLAILVLMLVVLLAVAIRSFKPRLG
ncbi:MAG: ABC transporter permease [Gemmatimonadaceae bacterium]